MDPAEENEEERLLAAPVEFKRMLSWQLSSPTDVPSSRKKKRKRKKSQEASKLADEGAVDDGELFSDEDLTDGVSMGDSLGEFAYVYVNSEGEEELYYSAPESPLTSEEDEPLTTVADDGKAGNAHRQQIQDQRPKRSRKSKKKARYLARIAKVEFFQPLCDLVEDQLCVDVDRLKVSSYAQVPTLTEICIQKIRDANTHHFGEGVPFLINSLLTHDKHQRKSIAVHVRWLERFLAILEKQSAVFLKEQKEKIESGRIQSEDFDDFLKRPLGYQPSFSFVSLHELPIEGEGLHCPLPFASNSDDFNHDDMQDPIIAKILLHFINFIYPLMTTKGSKVAPVELSGTLSPSQLAAIHYVNEFVTTRYKSVCQMWPEFLKVWPGYVYWARGQLKLAANAFISSLDLLSRSNAKACMLNELGRMFLMFGDRSLACRYFRQAFLTAKPNDKDSTMNECATQISTFALEASTWDCGLLTPPTAREAARLWTAVLKESRNITEPAFPWYFHAALVESRLCFHADQPVGEDPSSPLTTVSPSSSESSHKVATLQWLHECEHLISRLAQDHPVLYYHLSIVYALQGLNESSLNAWRTFMDRYYGFHEWPYWIEDGTSIHLFSSPSRNPWQPLLSMLSRQRLKCAPVMKIHWRLRLLHPHYPYYFILYTKTFLGDHCATPPGLRLSPDGYLTGDFQLDLPPMRCVLIDPYTGALQLSRSSALHHYNLHTFIPPTTPLSQGVVIRPDRFTMPWPLRVFESDQCIVELQLASVTDLENSDLSIPESNYHASLHWYGQDDTQGKLNIRKLVRKQLRESVLKLAEKLKYEKNEELLDKLMSVGRAVQISDLKDKFLPKYGFVKGKGIHRTRQRQSQVFDFQVMLTYRAVYGQGTLVMCFNLNPTWEYNPPCKSVYGQALVFVNCTTLERFLKPKIYCVGDRHGFSHLYPSPAHCSAYQDMHLKHLSYITAVRGETSLSSTNKVHNVQLVFDQHGKIVLSQQLNETAARGAGPRRVFSVTIECKVCLGNRLFTWKLLDGSTDVEVCSYDLKGRNELKSAPFKSNSVLQFIGLPGLLILHTNNGVALLHPGSLKPINIPIEGANSSHDGTQEAFSKYQFDIADARFNVMKVWDVGGCEADQGESDISEEDGIKINCDIYELPSEEDSKDHSEGATLDPSAEGASGGESAVGGKRESGVSLPLDQVEFGHCVAALTVDDRLLVIKVEPRSERVHVLLDLAMPGMVTELHSMGKSGYMISVTKFPDHFRDEIYWLSETGQLMGVLPVAGKGPHGFFSAHLGSSKKSTSLHGAGAETSRSCGDEGSVEDSDGDDSGLYVFFNDGLGGISCIRPTVS